VRRARAVVVRERGEGQAEAQAREAAVRGLDARDEVADDVCDWPASMSKSTPMSPDEAQRPMNVAKPASVPQVKEPAAPPVETMYLTPALVRSDTFAVAIAAPVATPAQFSLPHSPVANASVIVFAAAAADVARERGRPCRRRSSR
jgi:hypothetical protein